MGISPSKRVSQTLSNSPVFNPSCDSVFNDSLSTAQFAFNGIKPYQLLSATLKLHTLFVNSIPIVSKWVPTPPDRSQMDRAYQTLITRRRSNQDEDFLDVEEFRMFELEVFSNAVVSRASEEFVKMLPIGVVGIGGVGVAAKANFNVVGAAIVSYALSVATVVYLGLGG